MKMATSKRSLRLGDQIMRELAEMLTHDVQDPRLELVSISGVQMNADLKIARVLFTTSGDAKKISDAAKALDSAKGFLRSGLGRRLKMKFVPDLRFEHDEFLEDMVYARPPGPDSPDIS